MDADRFTLTEEKLPDISPRLTPLPDDGTAERRSLNGVWRFVAGGDEPPAADSDWRRHEIPGQWTYEGYDVGPDERGWYRREFAAPRKWDGRVMLRFDAVYSDAIVVVNDERIGRHAGGYAPFEFDVTDAVDPGGGNVLDVGVSETSDADDLGQESLGGGIVRNVRLLGLPDCHLADLDLETTVDGERATVRTVPTVANAGSAADAAVTTTLIDPEGNEVGSVERDLGHLGPNEDATVALEVELDGFEAWHPEHPQLYELVCEVRADGERERITEWIGIREIEVDGDRLLLNGEPITLRGVNWREAHPERGLAIPVEATKRDARRLREANVNYVRTGHHPTSEAFVEACDELGIVVEMEAPIAFLRFEDAYLADDPELSEPVCRQLLEIAQRDKRHPSVCIWSLANESDWGPNFEAAARLLDHADPTRPKTFNWGQYLDDDAGFCEIANHHYPALRDSTVELADFEDFDRPVLFDEFAHLYCYDGDELGSDPGLRDDYVRVLEAAWDAVRSVDACAGTAIWAGLDHLSPEYRWGILDRYRRPRPEYWHVKKVYAPVGLGGARCDGDEIVVELENRADSANLGERRIAWTADDRSGVVDADVPPGETGTVAVPAGDAVTLTVEHPAGFAINEFDLGNEISSDPPVGGIGLSGDANGGTDVNPGVSETETAIRLETETASLAVERTVGRIELVADSGTLLDGLPSLAATPVQSEISVPPMYGGTVTPRLRPWRCEDVRVIDGGAGIEVRGGYYYDTLHTADGAFRFQVEAPETFSISYDFTFRTEQSVRELGLLLPVARSCDTLSWERNARWSVYPDDHIGRPSGCSTAFPGGERPDSGALDPTRPWSTEATPGGTNDFRSTKRNVYAASLGAPDGRALSVLADGDQHVRCTVRDDGVDLLVLDRSIVGTGLALLDRFSLLEEDPLIEAGTRIQGSTTLRVQSPASSGD